jgi:hypothetical protein
MQRGTYLETRKDGAEYLLLVHGHISSDTGEERRAHKVALLIALDLNGTIRQNQVKLRA